MLLRLFIFTSIFSTAAHAASSGDYKLWQEGYHSAKIFLNGDAAKKIYDSLKVPNQPNSTVKVSADGRMVCQESVVMQGYAELPDPKAMTGDSQYTCILNIDTSTGDVSGQYAPYALPPKSK